MENHTPQDQKPGSVERKYWVFALRIIGDFGVTIAVPIVAFALLGKWLDGRFGTRPYLLIVGFVLAAIISGRLIYTKAKRLGKEYQSLDQKK